MKSLGGQGRTAPNVSRRQACNAHWFGTDEFGHVDLTARVIYGALLLIWPTWVPYRDWCGNSAGLSGPDFTATTNSIIIRGVDIFFH